MTKILRFMKPYIGYLILIVLIVSTQAFLDFRIVDETAKIIGFVGKGEDAVGEMLITGGFAMIYVLSNVVASIIVGFLSARVSMGIGRTMRQQLFDKVESFSISEINKFSTSSLITRTTNDITQVTNFLVNMLRMMISAPIMLVWGLVNSLRVNVSMTLIILGTIPVMFIILMIVLKFALPIVRTMQKRIDALTSVSREGLTGVRVIRAFNNDGVQQQRFDKANTDLTDNSVRLNRIMSVLQPLMMVLFSLVTVAVFWVGALIADSPTYIQGIFQVIQYSGRIMFSFMMLAMMFVMYPRAAASAVRINEVLQTKASINDAENPSVDCDAAKGMEFKDVTFYFEGAEEPSLSNINFSAKIGETTAIIGGTGCGKSTLLNTMMRFYDVTDGEIKVGGVNIKDIPQNDLRSMIGFVPQHAVLFNGTIKENMLVSKPDATEEEITEACKVAQAHSFVSSMPDGYDSDVSQGGTNLSGGQKQRLSIARAIVRKPLIYIFDDSFSALDFKTDAALRKALKPVTAGSIMIIVAQRVSTIMNAEQILMLRDGRIVGKGTHKELLESCPEYLELALTQLKKEELGL